MPTQHTPTPWMLDGRPSYLVEQDDTTKKWSVVAHGKTICRLGTTDEDRANAAFIVRAANNHHDILTCLKELYEFWQTDERDYDINEYEAIKGALEHAIPKVIAKAEAL